MAEVEEEKASKRSGWVVFGFIATAAYVAFIAWLLRWSDWVTRTAPPTANEWGDLLAGAFAPLAFLWLLIAVMVQAQELKLQRWELQLTRREFEQNREVAREQANEARKQAEFIGQQTLILQEDAEQAGRERASDEARTLVRLLMWQLASIAGPQSWNSMMGSSSDEFEQLAAYRRSLVRAAGLHKNQLQFALYSPEVMNTVRRHARLLGELEGLVSVPVALGIENADPVALSEAASTVSDKWTV